MAEPQKPEIEVPDELGDEAWRDEVKDVLRADFYGPGLGQWRRRPDRIRVTRRLQGGRSGRDVLELVVEWGSLRTRRVAKLDSAVELAAEWRGYLELADDPVDAFAPVDAVTRAVRDGTRSRPGLREAVIYNHVADFAAAFDEPLVTLEDLARTAGRGDPAVLEEAVAQIARLGAKTERGLYARYERAPHASSLRALNPELGPDVTVEVDALDAQRRLRCGPLPPAGGEDEGADAPLLYRDAVLRGGSRLDGELSIGDVARFEPVRLFRAKRAVLADYGSGVTIEVRPAGSADPAVARFLAGLPREPGEETVLVGRLVARRADRVWNLVSGQLPDVVYEDGRIRSGDAVTLFPCAPLYELFQRFEPDRVTSLVHGDLNPRNVTIAAGQPYLYDYAKTRRGRPLLADATWLELGLLRDALSQQLEFADVLLLQRLLNGASILLDAVSVVSELPDFASGLEPRFAAAFRMLWSVRVASRRSYPADAGPRWWCEYLTQAVISANRTFKWPVAEQSPAAVRATAAIAGAGAEALDRERPYRHWDPGALESFARWAFAVPAVDSGVRLRLTAELVAELDVRAGAGADIRPWPPDLEALRAQAAEQLIRDSLEAATTADPGAPGGGKDEVLIPLRAVTADGAQADALDLVAGAHRAVLFGHPDSGKTTLVRRLRDRLPAVIDASQLDKPIPSDGLADQTARHVVPADAPWAAEAAALLRIGAVRLIVDGLDELPSRSHPAVAAWISVVRREFPRTAIVVCRRSGSDQSLLQGFDRITLREPTAEQIEHYLIDSFRARGLHNAVPVAQALTRVLTDQSSSRRLLEGVRLPGLLSFAGSLVSRGDSAGSLPWSSTGDLLDRYLRQTGRPAPGGDLGIGLRLARQIAEPARAAAVIAALAGSDPVLAASLLGSMEEPPTAALDAFLQRQDAVLREPGSGAQDHRVAVAALVEYGRRRAREVLAAAGADADLDPDVRGAALLGLARLKRAARTAQVRARCDEALAEVVSAVLTEHPRPAGLCVTALGVVESTGLRQVDLHVAELIDWNVPWPVADAAMSALKAARIVLTRSVAERWAGACERRLAAIESRLPTAVSLAGTAELQRERLRLLTELGGVGRFAPLTARRFRFDLTADLHGLLLQHDSALIQPAAAELGRVNADSTAEELLAAAAAIAFTPEADLPAANALARGLTERMRLHPAEPGLMEALAALVTEIFAKDRLMGVRLALRCADVWERIGLPDRHRWPWISAFSRARGAPRDLEQLLLADDEGGELAVVGLSSFGFLRNADPGPGHRFGTRARRLLLARLNASADADDSTLWRHVIAAATMDLPEALHMACRLVARPSFGRVARTIVTAADGLIEESDLSEALAAVGYLGRLAAPPGLGDQVRVAHDLLLEADAERGPGVAAGRLAGLAYLGDWRTVLAHFEPDDPRSRRIAERAVTSWLPGPMTGRDGDPRSQALQWISDRLHSGHLPPGAESALLELREKLENPPGNPAAALEAGRHAPLGT